MEDWRNGGFGLYIHWPFCQSKCPYCDFNSHVAQSIDQVRWQKAYLAEIDRVAALTPGRVLNSVFFGGGTPSLMSPELVAEVLYRVRGSWTMSNDLEVTLEANPSSVEAGRFRGFAEAGVNRISMGVQALNDTDLQRLGRRHTAREAMLAFGIARDLFARVSFDLIYARQDQTLKDWKTELDQALVLAVDHLSLYQLTVEQGTPFADRLAKGGLHGLPDDDLSADMYAATQDVCARRGLSAYEVSNHAAPGAESRHNLIYWRMGDYAGIGPGAHGRLTLGGQRWATEALRAPGDWLAGVETTGRPELPSEPLSAEAQGTELALMQLRLAEGLELPRYAALTGRDMSPVAIERLQSVGAVRLSGTRLQATDTGRMVLNAVLRDLLTDQTARSRRITEST